MKINVLHVLPTFADCSITRIVHDIIEHLDSEQYHWVVAGPEPDEMMEEYQKLGAGVMTYKNGSSGGKLANVRHASQKLREAVEQHEINLVHTHTPTTTVMNWLGGLGKSRPPVVYTKHLLTKPGDRQMGWLYTAVDRLSLYQADYIVPVSQTMGGIITRFPGIGRDRVQAVQNAIDHRYFNQPAERESTRAEFGLESQHTLIGFTGRIERMKRLDLLLEAWSRLHNTYPDARLMIVGIGSLENELKAQTTALGLDRSVIWAGWRSDVPRLLAAMDIYVQPSANEGLSLSILEAMSAGKAVVATEVGGVHEVIDQGKNGTIIPPENGDALTKALGDLLADPEKRKEIGRTAGEYIRDSFDVSRMTGAYDSVYRRVANPS